MNFKKIASKYLQIPLYIVIDYYNILPPVEIIPLAKFTSDR